MTKNKIIIYIITAIILFAIPFYTVNKNYDLLLNGQEYLFKIEAVDPYDMFRGKYLDINFKENKIISHKLDINEKDFKDYYVEIKTDSKGFSYFANITDKKPKTLKNYYKTTGHYYDYVEGYIIDTPSRYYMNEKKIIYAEQNYNENINNAYVKVKVKNGNMIITGLYINNEPIESFDEAN